MQSNGSTAPQNVAVVEREAIIRRIDDGAEHILSKQSAHGSQLLPENTWDRSTARVDVTPVKAQINFHQRGNKTLPPTKQTHVTEFETLLCRSHSIDDSAIKSMMHEDRLPKATIINDSIHGHINFGPHAMAIIDTPQFQRLRNIKQLGSCHWVYPTATNTRFQHSLGVAHLARKFAEHLRCQYPGLVEEKDVKCVELAGLCHDLGHGPFSHLWEIFVHEANPECDWHHEDNSIEMLDYLIKDNDLKDVLLREGITDQDILFIKELICGIIDPYTGLPVRKNTIENGYQESNIENNAWHYRGRGEDKAFLYEIVANKISGIDVDKWDYFLRDKEYLKVNTVFDYQRFIMYSRVIKTGNPYVL